LSRRVQRSTARRYARALLEVATAGGDPAVARRELDAAAALVSSHQELRAALTHPALGAARKRKLLGAVLGERVSELTRRLLELLATADRIDHVGLIAEEYTALWNAQRGVAAAEAISATTLEAGQLKSLRDALARIAGLEVELQARADPALQGGLLVRMGGRTYDGTVKTQLRALRERLAGARAAPR